MADSCPNCNGEGYKVLPPTKFDLRHGESRRMYVPCPTCYGLTEAELRAIADIGADAIPHTDIDISLLESAGLVRWIPELTDLGEEVLDAWISR